MRITVRVPDDLGEDIKARTDNVSAYVVEALTEKLERERRRAARQEILERATDGGVPGRRSPRHQSATAPRGRPHFSGALTPMGTTVGVREPGTAAGAVVTAGTSWYPPEDRRTSRPPFIDAWIAATSAS